jgi:hypothetical protein
MNQYGSEANASAHHETTALRRAVKALNDIDAEVDFLRGALADGVRREIDGDNTQHIAASVRDLTVQLSIIGVLREVRNA